MTKKISSDDVEKIAHLARLELTSEEKSEATLYLAEILEYAERLQKVPTDSVEPYVSEAHSIATLRPDSAHKFEEREELLSQALRDENLVVARGVFIKKEDDNA